MIKDYGLHDGVSERKRETNYYQLVISLIQDTLQYKRKVLPYSVTLPDGRTLKFKLDNSRTVAENVKTVCSEAGKRDSRSHCPRFFVHIYIYNISLVLELGLPNDYEYSFETTNLAVVSMGFFEMNIICAHV